MSTYGKIETIKQRLVEHDAEVERLKLLLASLEEEERAREEIEEHQRNGTLGHLRKTFEESVQDVVWLCTSCRSKCRQRSDGHAALWYCTNRRCCYAFHEGTGDDSPSPVPNPTRVFIYKTLPKQ